MESGQFLVLPSCLLGSLLRFVLLKESNWDIFRSHNSDLRWNLWLPSQGGEVTQSDVSWLYITLLTKMQGLLPWLCFQPFIRWWVEVALWSIGILSHIHGHMCISSFLMVNFDSMWKTWLSVVTGIMALAFCAHSYFQIHTRPVGLEVWCFGFQDTLFIIEESCFMGRLWILLVQFN